MSLIRNALEQRSIPPMPDLYDYQQGLGGWAQGMVWHPSASGNPNTTDAMRLSAVFACLRLLSEAVSTLPLDTFQRDQGTRKPYRPRPDYLSFQPPQGSRIDYLSQVMLSLLTDGNAYVLTPRDRLGVPLDLIVLDPTLVQVTRNNGKTRYKVQNVDLDPQTDVMHIKGMMLPGAVKGLSPIAYARETIGLGLAAQSFGKAFFDNSALPSLVLMADGKLSQGAVDRWQATWNNSHKGTSNAHKVGVLEGGAKLEKVSVNPEDAQFLQTRQFQVPDIARIFGVPPHLIADASNSTSWGTGLQEQNIAFGQFSLRPWTERIEDGHGRLLTTHGLPNVFVKLNLDALLRASLKDRYDSYQVGITAEFLTINEARKLEDLPPVPWGDEPFVQKRVTETGPAPADLLNPPIPGGPQT